MYYNYIKNYIDKLTTKEIRDFAIKQGITLTEEEEETIYYYIKNHWQTFYYGNPKPLLEEIRGKLSSPVYEKIEYLYLKIKEKIN